MTTGIVFDIKKFSIHDGPGIRTTVFLKGCPLTCSWCHNPEGQARQLELMLRPERCIGCAACEAVCESGAIIKQATRVDTDRRLCSACGACVDICYSGAREIVGRAMTVAEVVEEVRRDSAFYDQSGGGVTFSGGEPLAQPAFIGELLQACHQLDLHTSLDTCGYAPWDVLENVRRDVDLFLYDLKLMDDTRHRQVTGVSNRPILSNLRRLDELGHRVVLRVPIVPGFNDDDDNAQALGAFSAGLRFLAHIELLSYHRIGRDKYERLGKTFPTPEVNPPSDEHVAQIARRLREFGLTVTIE